MLKLHFPILAAVCLCALQISADEQSQCAIASTIEADVAEIVDGINTKFDASDLVWMDGMRAPSKADRHGLSMAFQYAPSWPLSMIDETVDVAKASDMAIYREPYDEGSMRDGRALYAQ